MIMKILNKELEKYIYNLYEEDTQGLKNQIKVDGILKILTLEQNSIQKNLL